MPTGAGSGMMTGRALLLGTGEQAADLQEALERDGIEVVVAPTAPVALATLDVVDADCLIVVDGAVGRPADVFGAAQRNGHRLPGVLVGAETRSLPASVEQAPATAEAAASVVRQRLLAAAGAAAEPAVDDDALAAYGSTVAHELRNHLGVASLAIDSMEGPTKEQAAAALERLRDLATEAEAVATGSVTDVEIVDVAAVVADAADRIRVDAFGVETSAEGTVEANRALLTLLFENLFRNSVEHAGPETAVRVVDTEVGFAVVDDGPGFESERAFEWGYTTGSGQGTGLAVVRRIARAHGWQVAASNDGGARVDVRLT